MTTTGWVSGYFAVLLVFSLFSNLAWVGAQSGASYAQLLDGAKKDDKVVVSIPASAECRKQIEENFKRRFGINVDVFTSVAVPWCAERPMTSKPMALSRAEACAQTSRYNDYDGALCLRFFRAPRPLETILSSLRKTVIKTDRTAHKPHVKGESLSFDATMTR